MNGNPSKLAAWGIEAIEIQSLAMRENAVYKVITKTENYFLKVTSFDFINIAEKLSEMALLNYLNEHHFAVHQPVPTLDGYFVVESDEGLLTLNHWLDATPFTETMNEQHFFELGKMIAIFHQLTRQWQVPASFSRHSWNKEGLLGDNPHWGKFWENPFLNDDDQQKFLAFRDYAYRNFPQNKQQIIHADLVKENIFVDGNRLTFIDFDDMGIGDIHFELATVLLKNDHYPNYQQWRAALLSGYCQTETIDLQQLELYLAIRSVTYLGWIIKRPLIDRNGQISKRLINQALSYIQPFLR